MKEIYLTKGYITLVDDEDFKWLSDYEWCALIAPKTIYAFNMKENYMHIKILQDYDLWVPGLEIDHRNKNGLDNRKENLRVATSSQNKANASIRKDNTSGYKGVTWDKTRGLWLVRVYYNGKQIIIGRYVNKDHAARMYNFYAKLYYGEFASLNDVPD